MAKSVSKILVIAFLAIAGQLSAADVFLVRFLGGGKSLTSCYVMGWRDNATFFNQSENPALIRILGMSDGEPFSRTPDSFSVPPRTAVLLDDVLHFAWRPSTGGIAILHLDVPSGVIVEDHDDIAVANTCIDPRLPPASVGHASMPVFDHLTSAGEPQVHLGTDLGTNGSRVNVLVYNAAGVPATARIELRRTCNGSLVESRNIVVPPDTTLQTSLSSGTNECAGSTSFQDWSRYTVVTVDQPSLSLVSNVTKTPATDLNSQIPLIDVSVSHGRRF